MASENRMKLSERLACFRDDRPSSETIDVFIKHAEELQAQLAALQVKLTNTEWHLANEANLHAEAAAQLEAITTKHVELGDKLPNIHAHDRWLIMENVIKSEAILEDKK